MFKDQYILQEKLPDGVYYNVEPSPLSNFIFIKNPETNFSIKKTSELTYQPLCEKIYYQPGNFPYFEIDIRRGCFYEDCYIPPNAFTFHCKDNVVNVKSKPDNYITLAQYTEILYQKVKEKVKNILDNHDHIVLLYSGGIDSMTVLSFIIAMGGLPKTTIVNFDNFFVNEHPDLVRNSKTKSKSIDDLKKLLHRKCKDFIRTPVGNDDWLWATNNGSYSHMKSYLSTTAMRMFNNSAVIAGNHGNNALFHYEYYFDWILESSPDIEKTKLELQEIFKNKKLYMNSFFSYDVNKELMPLRYCKQQLHKFWEELGGLNRNSFYNPLEVDLKLCRTVDMQTVKPIDVMDCRVGREIINRNVGTMLDEFIIHRGEKDGDNYEKKSFHRSKFNPTLFEIPENITHNKFGKQWLQDLLNQEIIETNTIQSIKVLQHISKIHKKLGRIN